MESTIPRYHTFLCNSPQRLSIRRNAALLRQRPMGTSNRRRHTWQLQPRQTTAPNLPLLGETNLWIHCLGHPLPPNRIRLVGWTLWFLTFQQRAAIALQRSVAQHAAILPLAW